MNKAKRTETAGARDGASQEREMRVEMLGLSEIRPYERNPRRNEAAVRFVANSIRQFGFRVPIVVDRDGVVVCGHTRYLAAKSLGLGRVPCVRADDLDERQVRAFRVADNRTADVAEWDLGLLAAEIGEMPEFNFADFGFTAEDFKALELKPEEAAEEFGGDGVAAGGDGPERVRRDEIWRTGGQWLMCGDATSEDDVKALAAAAGGDVALLLTDPPYNVGYEGGTEEKLRIENDDMEEHEFREFITRAFKAVVATLRPGAAFYVWHADVTQRVVEDALNDAGLGVREQLVWCKNTFCLGRKDYQWAHETCFYGWKDGAAHYFNASRSIETLLREIGETDVDRLTSDEARSLLRRMLALPRTTLAFKRPTHNADHPTMKPVELFKELVANSSRYGELVLDPFAGSGTTGVACHRLGRRSALMEIDPRYASRLLARLEAETGEKAARVRGG